MKSIGVALSSHRGVAPGFDFLRIWLAGSVIWFHTFVVTGQSAELMRSPAWLYIHGLMPMFFALSGFLIAGSAERLNLPNFLVNRGLRIVPALAVEITLSALILGPVFTVVSLPDYFTDPLFWHYFTNIFGWIQYQLPGVFPDNPSAGVVNQSLWTVPFEVGCYILISLVIVFRLARRPRIILAAAAALLAIPAVAQWTGMVGANGKTAYVALNYLLFTRGSLLFPAFLLGASVYHFRDRIMLSPAAVGALVGAILLAAVFGGQDLTRRYDFNAVMVPGLVYLTAAIGLLRVPAMPFYSSGDYSYGVYLYGYPIQQGLFAIFPGFTAWLPVFLVSMLLSTLMATFSWHTIEKPILRLRKRFSFVARLRGVEGAGDSLVTAPLPPA